jgi:hypothetical protein
MIQSFRRPYHLHLWGARIGFGACFKWKFPVCYVACLEIASQSQLQGAGRGDMIVQKQLELTDFKNICFLCWYSGTCENHVSSNTCRVSLLPLSYTGHNILRQHHLQIKEITKNKCNGRWGRGGVCKNCCHWHSTYLLCIIIIINLLNDRSKASSKMIPLHSAI